MGASSGPGSRPAGRAASAGVSPVPASIPSAEALVALMSAWGSLPKHKFDAAYPFFDSDRQWIIEEYELFRDDRVNLEATALLFAHYADDLYASAIEARRAKTA